jgi:Sulfite exporter TauE/SafE
MTVVLPNGYVTLLEAAETLLPAMYAGVPDLPVVKSLRQKGIDVRDGPAMDQAVGELWKAVDEGGLRPMAIGGRPRRIERLDAAMTKQIPTLRHARGRGFTFLRQSNPAYHQPASCFGSDFPRATLAFRETEVHNLARKLIRTRRAALRADGRKARGRPSRQAVIISTVLELVERGKFVPLNGLKALTQVVKRAQRDCRHVRRKRRKIFNAKCGEASGNSCGDCDRIIFGLLVALGVGMIAESYIEIAPLGLLPLDPWTRIIAGLLFGFMIGAISSLLGVAGGEVIIPTLVFGFGVPVKTAGSLSMLISLPTVLPGIIRHAKVGAFGNRAADNDADPPDGVGFCSRCSGRRSADRPSSRRGY